MPFVQVAWLPKVRSSHILTRICFDTAVPSRRFAPQPLRPALPQACRNAAVRKEVSDAIIKAMVGVKSAEISPQNLVVRFSESVDGFPLPKGYSENPELRAPVKDS